MAKIVGTITWFYGSVLYEGVHPLESGMFRMKHRRDRRPGFPTESPFVFYPKYIGNLAWKTWRLARLYYTYHPLRRRLDSMPPPAMTDDAALKPADADEFGELQMYQVSEAARAAAEKARIRTARQD